MHGAHFFVTVRFAGSAPSDAPGACAKLSIGKQSLATTHSHLISCLSAHGRLQHYILVLSEHAPYSCPAVGTQIDHFLKEALRWRPSVNLRSPALLRCLTQRQSPGLSGTGLVGPPI